MNLSNPVLARVQQNVEKVIIGREETVQKLLVCLLTGGHVLLEDVPGTGKTKLARTMSASLSCGFARIQFMPDLLPGDITGMSVYQPKTGEFEFRPGPVFTNILLADELNRATPRTQSALLECMEEHQVTENGVTRKLEEPFMVIATQNPVEIQGTFPLPEAQLDRFLMRLSMGYPTRQEAVQMLNRFLSDDPLTELAPAAEREEILKLREDVKKVSVSPAVLDYISAIAEGTRRTETVQLGVSPRGMLALCHACQAWALMAGRDYVIPDDVKDLAESVLAHRVIVKGMYGRADAGKDVIRAVLANVPVPTEEARR